DGHDKYKPEELAGALYLSFSRKRDLNTLKTLKLRLFSYFLLEPPLVDKKMYDSLPELTKNFENVFIHNLTGDCYSLKNVDVKKLRKLFWPQPHGFVSEKHWNNQERMHKVVLINGHHKPHSFTGRELYSQRIIWATKLSRLMEVDLYGRGWLKKLTRSSLWLVYIKNYQRIKEIYKGPCSSKLDVISKYKFYLCFENLRMDGYITEKIFDCFYAGTIPIYWGGDDIEKWIPSNCYIDSRKFPTPLDLSIYLKNISDDEVKSLKEHGKKFLGSDQSKAYFNMFISLKPLMDNKSLI
ncbi:MAG: hypothetical protein H7336_10970, partial [Bacteriovorax sp.]|nr:hypothetical protein [Bacteriovorax sp.]